MANKNNKIEDFVSNDDDPTAELEVLSPKHFEDTPELTDAECEADAKTFDIDEFKVRNAKQESVSRLHYDIEQLHAKWLGLESEISAREEQTEQLNKQIAELEDAAKRREKLLAKRERKLDKLTADVQERDQKQQQLSKEIDELQRALKEREDTTAAALAQFDHTIRDLPRVELLQRLENAEGYADNIRQQLQDLLEVHAGSEREFAKLREEIEAHREAQETLEQELSAAHQAISDLKAELAAAAEQHAADADKLQERLDSAKATIAESTEVNSKLAADLAEVRDAKTSLEQSLESAEQSAAQQIGDLKSQLESVEKRFREELDTLNQELATAQHIITDANAANDQLTSDLAAVRDEKSKLEDSLAAAERSAAEQIADLETRVGEMKDATARLEGELSAKSTAHDVLQKDNETLQHDLDDARETIESVRADLSKSDKRHAEELRTLRFELGAAQDTMSETSEMNSQLASDLVEIRNSKQELEQSLRDSEQAAADQIKELESRIAELNEETEKLGQKVETKNDAINVLLAELAKKTEQIEALGNIEEVIHEIDDRITERIDTPKPTSQERMTRLLVGTVEGQVLRFPLFKDRLTIGRTDESDIQLKAAYVSRRHAVVQTDQDVTRIIDWGSKNGVMVNGERVTEHFLDHGDIVTIGNARFRYEERPKREA